MLKELPDDVEIRAGRDLGNGTRSKMVTEREQNPGLNVETLAAFRALQ